MTRRLILVGPEERESLKAKQIWHSQGASSQPPATVHYLGDGQLELIKQFPHIETFFIYATPSEEGKALPVTEKKNTASKVPSEAKEHESEEAFDVVEQAGKFGGFKLSDFRGLGIGVIDSYNELKIQTSLPTLTVETNRDADEKVQWLFVNRDLYNSLCKKGYFSKRGDSVPIVHLEKDKLEKAISAFHTLSTEQRKKLVKKLIADNKLERCQKVYFILSPHCFKKEHYEQSGQNLKQLETVFSVVYPNQRLKVHYDADFGVVTPFANTMESPNPSGYSPAILSARHLRKKTSEASSEQTHLPTQPVSLGRRGSTGSLFRSGSGASIFSPRGTPSDQGVAIRVPTLKK